MFFRTRVAASCAAIVALAFPAAAVAQSAGDNQYTDPFGGQGPPSSTSHGSGSGVTPSTPSTAAPASSGGSGSVTGSSGSVSGSSSPSVSAGANASSAVPSRSGRDVPLAFTGFDAWQPAALGAILLVVSLALWRSQRRFVRRGS